MSFPRLKLPQRRKGTGAFQKLAADYNAVLDCLRELESRTQHLFPQPSPTVQPKMSPSGTTWTAAASSGGVSAGNLPWQPILYPTLDEVTQEATDFDIAFWFGTINGLMPSNQLDTGALTKFVVPDGIRYWVLTCTTNGKAISAVTITADEDPPLPEDVTTPLAPTAFKVLLVVTNRATVEGKLVCSAWHLRKAILEANPKNVIDAPKNTWGVGELAYHPYYRWEVLDA